MSQISAPVSYGELIDKMTILEIKSERISDAAKLINVRHELDVLTALWQQADVSATDISDLRTALKGVNEKLWDIEDNIRVKESKAEFDEAFIELARSVYFVNDQRAEQKRLINDRLGSDLVEEKSYVDYRRSETA